MFAEWTMDALNVLLYVGTLVFAIVGALNARISGMDPVGGVVLAFLTGFGGGTVRDLLIGAHPIYWINTYWPLAAVAIAVILAQTIRTSRQGLKKVSFVIDALGIGFFTVLGIERATEFGLNDAYAVVMGVITATFGGVISDIIRNEVPSIFKPGELYATSCLIGGIGYVFLRYLNLDASINTLICIAAVTSIRFSAHRWKIMSR